jgi:hypothetical protein
MPDPVAWHDETQIFLHLAPSPNQRMVVIAKISGRSGDQLSGFYCGCFGPGCAGKNEFTLLGEELSPKRQFLCGMLISDEPLGGRQGSSSHAQMLLSH